ncbi:VOC family protein [Novosphingobium beihaiensis]|uniref:VOC family protein n=1 Tax=Novosphingobium beihaiensis TaxID=2930389 RepID=A0ABT0BSY1_9SPHN|nr:VOC family protein [Novosphingobium beihaiensis]MCJ2188164.1 VOC family protein [Novosphingobium beihaiensis]
MTEKLTCGAHHIGLTVPDLDQARDFFCGTLGFDEVGGVPAYPAIFVSDGAILLTLWRAADPQTARAFDRRANIGLHHLALTVADDATLDTAWARLKDHPGVTVDSEPGPIGPDATVRHFLVFIPGGIRLELATPFA